MESHFFPFQRVTWEPKDRLTGWVLACPVAAAAAAVDGDNDGWDDADAGMMLMLLSVLLLLVMMVAVTLMLSQHLSWSLLFPQSAAFHLLP